MSQIDAFERNQLGDVHSQHFVERVAENLLAGFRSEDSETTTYTRELPFEAAADYYDFLDLLLRSDLSQSEVARLTSRSRNYNQFLRLLTAIEKAEALNTRVLID